MEIFLIRHTTPAITKGLIYGRTDVPLADSFAIEKKVIKNKLPVDIDHVFSSPSLRCTLLAREILDTFEEDKRLMELDFGLWEGETWDSVNRVESEQWMKDFINNCPPEGETLNEMNNRVISFWEELIRLPYHRIAIITHAGVIRLILATVNSLPLKSIFDLNVNYGEVVSLNIVK
ncbi:MAG: alpha-ribazole phosphatase [Mucilaginibacter sp.]